MQRPTGDVFRQTDRLVHRALEAAPGAPAGLRARLTQHFAAEHALRRRARALRIQAVAASVAVAAVLVLVFLNLDWFGPAPADNGPQTVSANESKPVPQPSIREPRQRGSGNAITPQARPANDPDPRPEMPSPPQQVEKPQPEPQQPPTPELPKEPERQPGPDVEQPVPPRHEAPRQPDGTQAQPPAAKAVIARLDGNAGRVRIRYGSGEWVELAANGEVNTGATVSVSRGTAELWLPGGSLLRFDGEITLTTQDKQLLVTLESKSVYADNLGTSEALAFAIGDLSATLPSGVAIARRDQAALELTCLLGECTLGGEPLAAGLERRLTARGLGSVKKAGQSRLTRDLPARVVYREDFDREPPGGLYGEGEQMKDGLLSRTGAGNYAAFRYNPTVTVLPGMVLRFRARTKAVTQMQLEVFLEKPDNQRCFNQILKPAKEGEWQVFEIRLADFADKQNPAVKMSPGNLLRNFKLHLEGTASATVEIDWVEYVRIQED